jgi:hypothetical protein
MFVKVILEYANMALLWSNNELCLHTSRVDFGGVWKVENKSTIFLKLCGSEIWVVTDRLKPVWLPARVSVTKCRPHEHAKSGVVHIWCHACKHTSFLWSSMIYCLTLFKSYKNYFYTFWPSEKPFKLLESTRNSAAQENNGSRYVQFRLCALCEKSF